MIKQGRSLAAGDHVILSIGSVTGCWWSCDF